MDSASAKARLVAELQAVKRNSGKTYGQIVEETGLTNIYVAQLLRRQAQLKPPTAPRLGAALTDDLLLQMMQPFIAVMHFGESIKEIINEDFGDGMTKIDTEKFSVLICPQEFDLSNSH